MTTPTCVSTITSSGCLTLATTTTTTTNVCSTCVPNYGSYENG